MGIENIISDLQGLNGDIFQIGSKDSGEQTLTTAIKSLEEGRDTVRKIYAKLEKEINELMKQAEKIRLVSLAKKLIEKLKMTLKTLEEVVKEAEKLEAAESMGAQEGTNKKVAGLTEKAERTKEQIKATLLKLQIMDKGLV